MKANIAILIKKKKVNLRIRLITRDIEGYFIIIKA